MDWQNISHSHQVLIETLWNVNQNQCGEDEVTVQY